MSAYGFAQPTTSQPASYYVFQRTTSSRKPTPRLRGMRLAGHYRGRAEQAR